MLAVHGQVPGPRWRRSVHIAEHDLSRNPLARLRTTYHQRRTFLRPVSLQRLQRVFLILFAESLKIGFAVRIEKFLSALAPRFFEVGRCDVPVWSAFLANSTQVVAEIVHRPSWVVRRTSSRCRSYER